ncbi:hypothetical protein [Nocardia jejuensis]|uniref:hypothetical protein n=1 Tax=Nocardia jejuensis TaxID=328049 RepID=UPI00082FDA18|nr:hypothetical protein [Nocardia jejuensis]
MERERITRSGESGVRVPADPGQLQMLRALAESIMMSAGFTGDVVTDVRIALDEVATTLTMSAAPGTTLECEFHYDAEQIVVQITGVTETRNAMEDHAFGRHLLAAITDSTQMSTDPFDDSRGGYPATVRFSRRRLG